MSKLFLLCLVAICAVLVEGNAFSTQEFLRAAANGDFNTLRKLINPAVGLDDWSGFGPDLSGSVASLKPGPDTHVYGQAESSYVSYSNDNGRVSKKSGGFGVVNKDGEVSTYKFTPKDIFGSTESNNNYDQQ
ncbi:uncharacterized protein LOC119829609 [Zerene cesonia]|uniref:uncharacterized protein LOC119829609 n=1 Tax=Zerene cesonia TaxID=33412 RepID=UPI0018E5A44E|nr:uncharacterized protein LOC119829609 [Zerene cesonia]